MSKFVHLHTHSHYSLLDGMSKIPDLVDKAKKDGMTALALTDHGNLYGAVEFYKACKAKGIKPILGIEAYIAPGDHSDHSRNPDLGRDIRPDRNRDRPSHEIYTEAMNLSQIAALIALGLIVSAD